MSQPAKPRPATGIFRVTLHLTPAQTVTIVDLKFTGTQRD